MPLPLTHLTSGTNHMLFQLGVQGAGSCSQALLGAMQVGQKDSLATLFLQLLSDL